MNNKGFVISSSIFATMLITAILIFMFYGSIVNGAVTVKSEGTNFIESIKERNALERLHAKTRNNPEITGEIRYEDLEINALITDEESKTIKLLRDEQVIRLVKINP